MTRRQLVVVLALGGAAAFRAIAQSRRTGPARIAMLDDASEATRRPLWAAFRKRLAELGYTDGRDVVIDARYGEGNSDRLRSLAAQVVASSPDVIVAVTTTAATAVRQRTQAIPIVAIGPADPVASGLVASLARPGGNVTGLAPNQAELAGKWLELLRAFRPDVRSLRYLTDTAHPGEMLVYRDLEQRARSLGIETHVVDGTDAAHVDKAFASMQSGTDGLIVATTAALLPQRRRIVDGAMRLRIPAVYARHEYVEAGGLVSYGSDSIAHFARAADYVDRILRGTPPSELPFEMASTFRLALNARTARALGLEIPRALRVRADVVID